MTYDEIVAALNAQQQQNAPQPNPLDASGNPNPSVGLLASSPPISGPGLTAHSFGGAFGPDSVTDAPTPPPQAAPSPLASTSQFVSAPTPQPSAGLLSPDVANAGVSSVPQFTAPVNPATPVHHSFIGGLLGKIGHVAKQGFDNFETNVAGLSAADLATMDPRDIAIAKRTALQGFLNRAAHPQMDARGFRESAFQSLGAGVGAGQEEAQGFVGRAREAAQYAAGRAQTQRLQQGRAALQAQFQILPGDSPEEVTNKVQQLAAGYAAIGDSQSLQALGQASSLFRQPKPPAAPRALEHVETIDPKTGKPAIGMVDATTGEVVKYLPAVPKPVAGAGEMSADKEDKAIDRINKTFRAETADFTKARAGYEVLQGAMKTPNLYSPIAMLDAYARTINPGAVVRPSTMELLEHTGAAPDRIRRWATTLDSGQWPADLSNALNASLTSIMKQHYTTAAAARTRALARMNALHIDHAEEYLDDLDFGPNTPGATSAATAPTSTTSTTRGNY